MVITKKQFQAYKRVRKSGLTNMWATKQVAYLSKLNEDVVFYIMQHYEELMDIYPDVRSD